MKIKWADLSMLIHNLLWKKCCYQSMLSSNRLNSLTSIYEFVSRNSAQDILQGYLKLPFSSFSMQLPIFFFGGGGGVHKKKSTHRCKWTNQFGIICCTLTFFLRMRNVNHLPVQQQCLNLWGKNILLVIWMMHHQMLKLSSNWYYHMEPTSQLHYCRDFLLRSIKNNFKKQWET